MTSPNSFPQPEQRQPAPWQDPNDPIAVRLRERMEALAGEGNGATPEQPVAAEADSQPATDAAGESATPEPELTADEQRAADKAASYELAGEIAARVSVHNANKTTGKAARRTAKQARAEAREDGDADADIPTAWNDRRSKRDNNGKRRTSRGTAAGQSRKTGRRRPDTDDDDGEYHEISPELGRAHDGRGNPVQPAEDYAAQRQAAQQAPGNAQRTTEAHPIPGSGSDDAEPVRTAPPATTQAPDRAPSPVPTGRRRRPRSEAASSHPEEEAAPEHQPDFEEIPVDALTYEAMMRRAAAEAAGDNKSTEEPKDDTVHLSPMDAWRANKKAKKAEREAERARRDAERYDYDDEPETAEPGIGADDHEEVDAPEPPRPPRTARRKPAAETDDDNPERTDDAEETPETASPRSRGRVRALGARMLSGASVAYERAKISVREFGNDGREYFGDEEKGTRRKVIAGVVGAAAVGVTAYMVMKGFERPAGFKISSGIDAKPDATMSDAFGSFDQPDVSSGPEVQAPPAEVTTPADAAAAPPTIEVPDVPNVAFDIRLEPGSNPWDAIVNELGYDPDNLSQEQLQVVDALKDYAVQHDLKGMDLSRLGAGTRFNIPEDIAREIIESYTRTTS